MKKIGLGLIAISLGLFLSGCGNKHNGYALHSAKYYESHPKQAEAIKKACTQAGRNVPADPQAAMAYMKNYANSNLAKDCANADWASLP